jgi:hypothetical protein
MSRRLACKAFNIPICALQVHLRGKTEVGARSGCPTVMPQDKEQKLVDFACNNASMGAAFGHNQFQRYAADLAKKQLKTFKNGMPSLHRWCYKKNFHAKMTLC